MAIFRSIGTLIYRKLNRSNLSCSRIRYFSSTTPLTPIDPWRRRHFLSRPNLAAAAAPATTSCPFFISSPPCKLSQSATWLHIQQDRRVGLLFPYKLCFQSTHPLQYGTNDKEGKESQLPVQVRDSFLNLPNMISLSRMLSGPFLAWMIVNDMYLPAFVGLAVSGATDWLDGYMARKMGSNSVVGSYLDPLADKVLIAFVALAMVDKGLLHPALVSLVVLRDVALVGGAVYKRASILEWKWTSWFEFFNLDGARAQKVEPLFISKVNTVFQLALVAAALLQPDLGNEETQTYITYLSWLVAMTTLASTAAYGAQHLRNGALWKNTGS